METAINFITWLRIPNTLEEFEVTPELQKIRDFATEQNKKVRK